MTRGLAHHIRIVVLVVSMVLNAPWACKKGEGLLASRSVVAGSQREASLTPAAYQNIILTWQGDPASSQAVTWRTDVRCSTPVAELVLAHPAPDFAKGAKQWAAKTTPLETGDGLVYYHRVNFSSLHPDTLYAYRVGNAAVWSEWFQFRTAADQAGAFSFLYFGDAQNDIRSMWSRSIRGAILQVPQARFMIHTGDLVKNANAEKEWRQWFQAGSWILAMVPSLPVVGNHEYALWHRGFWTLSQYWRPQFTLPDKTVPGLEETVYAVDYQGARIVVLNSNEKIAEQAAWLKNILARHPQRWTILAFHHPIYSSVQLRDNSQIKAHWKPVIDQYQVDLVLQGHDHIYGRGRGRCAKTKTSGATEGCGAVYVVSVSGPKMYHLSSAASWAKRTGENLQLFQVISVAPDTLRYQSFTVTGELYDAFQLTKQEDGQNQLQEQIPADVVEHHFPSR